MLNGKRKCSREYQLSNVCSSGSAFAISSFVPRETTRPTPTPKNQQLGNYIIARKTWEIDMDFKRQKKGGGSSLNKAPAKRPEGVLSGFIEGSAVTPKSDISGAMSGHRHVAARDLSELLSPSVVHLFVCLVITRERTSEGGCEESRVVAYWTHPTDVHYHSL